MDLHTIRQELRTHAVYDIPLQKAEIPSPGGVGNV